MGRIVVTEFVTLDGVIEDPGGSEGWEKGGWAFQFDRGPEGDRFKLEETMESKAMLLGRRTYDGFAAAWPSREDEMGFARKMNGMPKYVVSSTLTDPAWENTTVVSGDIDEAVRRLKRDLDGVILVPGSAQLAEALRGAGLVDEYRLMVFPVILGSGKRLFGEGGPTAMRLLESRPAGAVLIVRLEPVAAG
jgi:dihydrofolate reductase